METQYNIQSASLRDIEDELELKSGENNRLRKMCADLEQAMKDLYCSRKGNGSLQMELDSPKLDNERLLALLKETTEYGDMNDDQIQNIALRNTMKSAASVSGKSKKTAASTNGNESNQGDSAKNGGSNEAKNNDWIPTQAVRKILQIRDQFNGQMSETCIS